MEPLAARIPWEALLTAMGMCVAGLAWLIRVEVKGFYTRKDVERLEKRQEEDMREIKQNHSSEMQRLHDRIDDVLTKHDDLSAKVMDKLSKIENMVSKIEGQLEK